MSFIESELGVVLMATGLEQPLAWSPPDAQARVAGALAPETAHTLSVDDAGEITGEYAAFVRFVDRWGNVSLPSPFSNTATAAGAGTVVHSDLPPGAAGETARRQILRNTAGQSNVYYVDIDTADLSSDSLSSTRTDDDLSAQEAQVIQDEDGVTRYDRFYRPFDTFSVLASYNGRAYATGWETYTEGSVALTHGSDVVTGTAMFSFKNLLSNRVFTAPGSAKRFTIKLTDDTSPGEPVFQLVSIDEGADNNWDGATDAYSRYSIAPDSSARNVVYFSGAGAPESWHPADAFSVPEDGGRVTALVPLNSFLFVFKERRAYRFSSESDPLRDGFLYPSVGRGCVNHRTAVVVGDVAYVMDAQGVYAFDGREATPVSAAISDLFRGTNPHGYRVNWRCARYFHGTYCPSEQCVRFFVVLRGSYLPHHALCYSVEFGRWWLEEYEYAVGASCVAPGGSPTGTWQAGVPTVYLAGEGSKVWELGGSRLDASHAYANSVASATPTRITPVVGVGSGVVGSTLTILTGRAAGQTRKIVSYDSDVISLDRPLTVLPDAGDEFGTGVVPYRYLTHRLRFAESEQQDGHSVRIAFEPQGWGSVGVRRYIDHSEEPEELAARVQPDDGDGVSGEAGDREVRVDLTKRSGYAVVRGDRHLERDTPGARTVRVELVGASGPTPHAFSSIDVRGVRG